jgi:hypothetical protein
MSAKPRDCSSWFKPVLIYSKHVVQYSKASQSVHYFFNPLGRTFFDLIIVDNTSTDGSTEMVERTFSKVKLRRNSANIVCAVEAGQVTPWEGGTRGSLRMGLTIVDIYVP